LTVVSTAGAGNSKATFWKNRSQRECIKFPLDEYKRFTLGAEVKKRGFDAGWTQVTSPTFLETYFVIGFIGPEYVIVSPGFGGQ